MVKSPFPWQDSTRFRCARESHSKRRSPHGPRGGEGMKVGFIGLGTMGASMASNLQAGGHELQVGDVREEAGAPHLKAGGVWGGTPRAGAGGGGAGFTPAARAQGRGAGGPGAGGPRPGRKR